MKKLFTILESERERILNMHIDAIKNNYLTEQASTPTSWSSGVLPANFDVNQYDISKLDPTQKNNIDTKLKDLVGWIDNPKLSDKQITITIEAATSTSGSYETNERLTRQRYESGKKYVDAYLKTNLPENIYTNITYQPKLEIMKGVGKDNQYFRIDANATATTKGKETPKGRKLFWEVEQDAVVNVKRIKYCAKRGSNWVIDGKCNEVRDAFYQNAAGRWIPACNNQILKSKGIDKCFQYEGTSWFKSRPECVDKFEDMTNFKPEFENLRALDVTDTSGLKKLDRILSSWCKTVSF
jgi:hypothetical protein